MRARTAELPVLVVLIGATGVAMMIPALHALVLSDFPTARAFFYSGLLLAVATLILGLATQGRGRSNPMHRMFPMLAAIYLVLPLAMALPLTQAVPDLTLINAWFEMVSSFTTTGASIFDAPRRIPESLHLWRAMAGWAGGLFILVVASGLFAPLGLGGGEMLNAGEPAALYQADTEFDAAARMWRHLVLVGPLYLGVTMALWALLILFGVSDLLGLMQAMGTISTSGILPREDLGKVGIGAEAAMAVFMVLALSRRFWPGLRGQERSRLRDDPELRLAVVIVAALTLLVMARHWLGAFEISEGENLPALGRTAWGAAFTGLSFLTTTGFVGQDWVAARAWSGLTAPGLILVAMVLMGGGVATTAGGVKLLRVYALSQQTRRELERSIYPSAVYGGGTRKRFLRREGAQAAWLFIMIFAITCVALVTLLVVLGKSFDGALILAVAALTTTGPLAQIAGDLPLHWGLLSDPVKIVLGLMMILGRLEILAILALVSARLGRN
jgi:trk system potassium uptake protein TrkH